MQKRKVVKKKPTVVQHESPIKTTSQLKEALQRTVIPRYPIGTQPPDDAYVMPNKVAFLDWLDRTYAPKTGDVSSKAADCESMAAKQSSSVELFAHQKFIKDYLQADSPYRGILLYHGIGVGKSCSSIAAAEILMNKMKVIVMLPASLRDNYIGEMKKCGTLFYGANEHHWVFVPDTLVDREIIELARITSSFVKEYGGMWVPLPDAPPNWEALADTDRDVIRAQIDLMISHSVRFIHYNGLTTKSMTEMTEDGKNPFDDRCVVVDEIHNLISMVANDGKIGRAVYNLLMQAKNMKLILLSGTPLINYPHEIAHMLNLVTGPRKIYELKTTKTSSFNAQSLRDILATNEFVDWFDIDTNNKKLQWTLLPHGFKKVPNSERIQRVAQATPSHEEIVTDLLHNVGQEVKVTKQAVTSKDAMALPEKEVQFNEYFVDFTNNAVRNPILFMRRILGTVSFYSTYSPELYPSVEVTEVPLEMNDHQFNAYEKARGDERKMEKSSKKGGNDGNIFKSSGQVYRFYSRAICNFVFPEAIERPFPTSMKKMTKEVDDIDDDLLKYLDEDKKEGKSSSKSEMTKQYKVNLAAAIKQLTKGDYLTEQDVYKYSPKFKNIYDRIQDVNGCVLVYSQFRQVEGLGLFAEFLKRCGYAEFKIKWEGKDWDLDISEEDMDKPKYISFTGSNEETRVLLGIFNSTNIPPRIKEKLGPKASNLRGDTIKVLMITKSGAEGISLKNVRQVHIMEPYWNHIRIDQVIGRAVRTCSHSELPKEDRKVEVFIYLMAASAKQLKNSFTMRTQDKSMTSDQFIYDLAKRKAKIVGEFLQCMQRASVDCGLNAKKHGRMKCFVYPINADPKKNVYQPYIALDVQDNQYTNEVETLEWRGRVFTTKKGTFLIRPETNEVYDYDMYHHSGRLMLLGTISENMKTIQLLKHA